MALQILLIACILFSPLAFGQADFGFETLSKPFTGAQQSLWEQVASRNIEGQRRRSSAKASASCKLNNLLYPYPFAREHSGGVYR